MLLGQRPFLRFLLTLALGSGKLVACPRNRVLAGLSPDGRRVPGDIHGGTDMVLTPSTMLALGTPMPRFTLRDVVTGRTLSSRDLVRSQGLLVMFISRHCPYVVHIKHELARFAQDYEKKNVGIVAIASNDVENYPADAPERLREMALDEEFIFPILFDEDQAVARAFRAACTPDFFLFDCNEELVYRGQFDEGRPGNGAPVDGRDLRAAMTALLDGDPPPLRQIPSMGCNIKWKSGKEPDYFRRG